MSSPKDSHALSFIGIELPDFAAKRGELKGNEGMGVRNVTTTSVQNVYQSAREKAWGAGLNTTNDARDTATNTGAIRTEAEAIKRAVESLLTETRNLPQNIADRLKLAVGRAQEAALGAAADVPSSVASGLGRAASAVAPFFLPLGAAQAAQMLEQKANEYLPSAWQRIKGG